ncbi:MAG: NDP-sugar synthase [Acidimicrobiia bacterium]
MASTRAVVLAAGAGTRLRPLTDRRPKPLCPVGGTPLVDLALARARTAVPEGHVAVNVHHGRGPIEAHLAGSGVEVSVEEREALGTAGALGRLRDWIAGADVLVLNADTWAPGPLGDFVRGGDGQRIRLLLAGSDRFEPTSRVVAALMPWAEVAPLRAEPSGLYEVSWRAAAAAGRIEVVRHDGPFVDCGTPARYLAANLAAAGGASVVDPGARCEGRVERSVVWPGASVHRAEHLVDAVRADGGLTVLVRPGGPGPARVSAAPGGAGPG